MKPIKLQLCFFLIVALWFSASAPGAEKKYMGVKNGVPKGRYFRADNALKKVKRTPTQPPAVVLPEGTGTATGPDPNNPIVKQAPDGPFKNPLMNAVVSPTTIHKYWINRPDKAPEPLKQRFEKIKEGQGALSAAGSPGTNAYSVVFPAEAFNLDTQGSPQNEESIAASGANFDHVLGGANDYRGFFGLDPEYDATGWYYSNNGGASVLKEGMLPALYTSVYIPEYCYYYCYYEYCYEYCYGGYYYYENVPSSGDPATVSDGSDFYAASLNVGYFISTLGVYKTNASTLNGGCAGDSCWPTRSHNFNSNLYSSEGAFQDKEWLAVGPNGSGGKNVWLSWTHFYYDGVAIMTSRFDSNLNLLGSYVLDTVDGTVKPDDFLQFSYISVAPNGKTYVTWARWVFNISNLTYSVQIRMSVWNPASGTFSPAKTLRTESRPVYFGRGTLRDTGFRMATHPKSAVRNFNSTNRLWVFWDKCKDPFDTASFTCSDSDIVGGYTDNDGASFTYMTLAAGDGHQFFPTQPSHDPTTGQMLVGYYSTVNANKNNAINDRYDVFVAYAPGGSDFKGAFTQKQITSKSTAPYTDWWWLSWRFIGDYFSIYAKGGKAYAHYNAESYRKQPLPSIFFGVTIPVYQQDNFLGKITFP